MNKRPLYKEILEFSKTKKLLAIPLFILGLLGLILPIIPGLALIFIASLFLFPKESEKLLDKIKQLLNRLEETN